MSYDAFSVLLCVLAGLLLGTVGFAFKVISTGSVGATSRFMDKDEDDKIKIFSFWNLSFYSLCMTSLLIWQSTYEHSYVSLAIRRAWESFVS